MLDSFTGGLVVEHPVKSDQVDQTQSILQKMRSTFRVVGKRLLLTHSRTALRLLLRLRPKWSNVTIIIYAL